MKKSIRGEGYMMRYIKKMKKQLSVVLAVILLFGALPLDPIFAAIFEGSAAGEVSGVEEDPVVMSQLTADEVGLADEPEVIFPEVELGYRSGDENEASVNRGPPQGDGYIGIEPLWTNVLFDVEFEYCEETNPDPAVVGAPFPVGAHYWVTNPTNIYFTPIENQLGPQYQDLNGDYIYRTSLWMDVHPMSGGHLIPEEDGNVFDFEALNLPEGRYFLGMRYWYRNIDYPNRFPQVEHIDGQIHVNIQRTSSYVDIEGVVSDPTTIVRSPDTVVIGRPDGNYAYRRGEADVWGDYRFHYVITNQDGYVYDTSGVRLGNINANPALISGYRTRTTTAETEELGFFVGDWAVGVYTVTIVVEEYVTHIPGAGTTPAGQRIFPDADIHHTSTGVFEIVEDDEPIDPIIEKSADRDTVFEGEEIEYTITVRNPNATHVWEDLVVVDHIRVDLVEFLEDTLYIDGSPAPAGSWSFDEDTGELRVYIDSIDPNSSIEITFNVRVRVIEEEEASVARVGIMQALREQSLFAAPDVPAPASNESGYIGIDPLITAAFFEVEFEYCEDTNPDPAVVGAPWPFQAHYWVTNPTSISFTTLQGMGPDYADGNGDYIYRVSFRIVDFDSGGGSFYFPMTDGGEINIDAFNLLEGRYSISVLVWYRNLDPTRLPLTISQEGAININIQRTSSFVDIEGVVSDPNTIVRNPDTVVIGRPDGNYAYRRGEADIWGDYRFSFLITNQDGYVYDTSGVRLGNINVDPTLISGYRTRTTTANTEELGFFVGDWSVGVYTVTIVVEEYVTHLPGAGTTPAGQRIFPDADIRHTSTGVFEIVEDDNPIDPEPGTIPNTAILYCIDGEDEVECGRDTEIVELLVRPSIEKDVNVAPGTPVEIGEYVEYTLTVTNPNDVGLEDFLVVDNLANGALTGVRNVVVSPDYGYDFEIDTYLNQLRVYLDYLPANASIVITFEARVAEGTAPGPVVNVVHLYDYDPETGDTELIDECEEEIILEEQPTTAPATTAPTDPTEPETTVPETTVPETTVPETTVPAELYDPTLQKQVCILEEVESLADFILRLIALEGDVCEFGDVVEAEVGQTARYRITVINPNDVVLEDFVVVDTLNLSLVEFVPGSVRINGAPAVSPEDYTFNEVTGELRVYLPVLSANGTYLITFDVIVLAGNENDEIPNTVYLYGPEDEETGNREIITEDDALITVEEDPEPTTVPETTVPETTVPETTVPATTAPTDPTEPETTVPETTVPETTAPATIAPTDPTEPETTVPETTVPATTAPATTAPTDPTEPETTVPETTVPETTVPETTVPETTVPAELYDPTLQKQVCILEEVESLVDFVLQLIALDGDVCEFGDVFEAEVGETARYRVTVINPNDVALEDFVVVDTLNLSLVEFVPGSVRINGAPAVFPEDYTFNPVTGELRVYLPVLSANGIYVITFDVIVLAGNENDEIPNTAYLFGPEDSETGDRDVITEDDALITVEEDPEPTTAPEPTTVPATTAPTDPTEPETTVPETTVPETTVPETTVPETTVPVETVPPTTTPTEPEPTCPEDEVYCPTEPVRGSDPKPTTPSNRPTLPQTGVMAGTALLSGTALATTGLLLTSKRRRK